MRRGLLIAGAVAACTLAVPTTADAGGGCHREKTTYGSGAVVELSGACMSPGVLRTESATVKFVNRDGMAHNVFGEQWGSGELLSGEAFEHTFASSGTYAFVCTLHPGMVGAVVVGDGLGGAPVTEISAARPVAAASSAREPDDAADRLALGLVVGLAAGVAGTIGARRLAR